MRKYLVNYRELNPTVYTSYTEYTTIYETEGMMTQEDVEAFEKAKTKERERLVTMVSFHELSYTKAKKEPLPRLVAFVLYDTLLHERVLVYTNETEVEKYYVDENTGEKFIVLIDPKTGKKREYYCAENGIFFSDEDIYKVCPISWLKKCNKCCLFSMEYEYYEHTNTYEPHN